jgi:hypothetical protein
VGMGRLIDGGKADHEVWVPGKGQGASREGGWEGSRPEKVHTGDFRSDLDEPIERIGRSASKTDLWGSRWASGEGSYGCRALKKCTPEIFARIWAG